MVSVLVTTQSCTRKYQIDSKNGQKLYSPASPYMIGSVAWHYVSILLQPFKQMCGGILLFYFEMPYNNAEYLLTCVFASIIFYEAFTQKFPLGCLYFMGCFYFSQILHILKNNMYECKLFVSTHTHTIFTQSDWSFYFPNTFKRSNVRFSILMKLDQFTFFFFFSSSGK